MSLCWIAVSLWLKLNWKALRSGDLRVWLDAMELRWKPFDRMKARLMSFANV